MGFSVRGRTKGKSSWFNYSASKRGLHGSYSQKLGKDLTLNFSKRGNRVTYNFGNGIRWTATGKKTKTKTQATSNPTYAWEDWSFPTWVITFITFIIICVVIYFKLY